MYGGVHVVTERRSGNLYRCQESVQDCAVKTLTVMMYALQTFCNRTCTARIWCPKKCNLNAHMSVAAYAATPWPYEARKRVPKNPKAGSKNVTS